jgi:hypothetical protein
MIPIKLFNKQISHSFLSFIRILFFRPSLLKKRPKKKDETVYLIANGPSLKKTLKDHSTFLQSKKSGVVNFFAISPEFIKLKPSYYFLLDQAFFQKNKDQKLNDNIDLLRSSLKNVNWRMTLVLPKKCKALFSIDNEWISYEYINTNIFQSFSALQHSAYKRNWGMPQAQNVLVFALYALVYLRIPKIYLLGANHNWHEGIRIREDNKLIFSDPHFYKENKQDTERELDTNIADFFESISKAFRGYEVLSIFATKSNANIINLDTSSFIDSFPKESLETKK